MPLNRTPPASSSPKGEARKNPSTIKLTASTSDLQHSQSVSDLRTLAANITERKKRKFAEDDCDFYSTIKEMFDTFSKEQEIRFQDLSSTIKELNIQNIELRNSVQLLSSKYDEFLEKVSMLESERLEDKKMIKLLEERLELQERKSRGTGIEVRNLPKIPGETKENLCNDVIQIGKTLDLNIDSSKIRDIYRIPAKDGSNPVIVEFTSVLTKDTVLRGVKCFNKSKPKGCSIPGWWRDRRHAHTGEMVPGHGGPLPQLAQHHARAGGAGRVLHAPGDDARHRVDVARGLPRAAAHSLTHSARYSARPRNSCRA